MNQKGVLLINLGTPDHCDPSSVRRYLREFLMDARVIDLPWYLRWPLVNLIIIPFRYKKTAHAYQQIWSEAGSPLLAFSKAMVAGLSEKLGPHYHVELGMRYGHPTIASAAHKLRHCESVKVIPLFPQYASASTGSAIERVLQVLSTQWNIPTLEIQKDFYQHPGFITAFANTIKKHMPENKIDKIVFSYHGLPERHIDKSECHASCDKLHACPVMNKDNLFCYRAQCYATTALIAQALNLKSDQYVVAFQSRLGKTPWIQPFSDMLLPELSQQGVKNIAIVCPSFVADCLETLEEVSIRMRAQWMSLGGDSFTFIPCLNESADWINALAEMVVVT